MKFITAIIVLIIAVVANAQSPTFTDCATGTPDMNVTSFSVSPYPLCVGEKACFTATGTLQAPIVNGATLSIVGKFLGCTVYTDNRNLCELLAESGQPCPVATSVTSITFCPLVKPTAPVGISVALTIQATNGSGNILFCQTGAVHFQNCP